MNAATGRADYDASLKLATLTPQEPIFVLRAGDTCAADAVRGWAALAHAQGAPVEAIELALQQADRMEAWPARKTPNGPDLTEDQRKQLRYQHGRRAWSQQAGLQLGGEDVLLAAQLGRAEVMAKVRPLVIQLLEAILREGLKPADLRSAHAALAAIVTFAGYDVERMDLVLAREAAD